MHSGKTSSRWFPKRQRAGRASITSGVPAVVANRWASVKSSPALFMCCGLAARWKALRKSFDGASPVHKHFQRWRGQGFFLTLWQAGLAEYDDLEGIAWEWQSIDGTQGKAPLAQEAVGNNPTDRGEKRQQAQLVGGRGWRPAVPYRQRRQSA